MIEVVHLHSTHNCVQTVFFRGKNAELEVIACALTTWPLLGNL